MKKILFLIILLASISYSQIQVLDTLNGAATYQRIGTWFGKTNQNGVIPMPVQMIAGSWSDVGVNYFRGTTDTVGTSTYIDTLSRRLLGSPLALANNLDSICTYWWQVSIIADDTIEVCTSPTFIATRTIVILPDIPWASGMLKKSQYSNLYLRRYVSAVPAGIPRYYITYQGN